MSINNTIVKLEVDTGCAYTLIPKSMFEKLKINDELQPSSLELVSYTDGDFQPLGETTITAQIGYMKRNNLPIYIVDDKYAPLCGRYWMRMFGLDKQLDKLDALNKTLTFSEVDTTYNVQTAESEVKALKKEFSQVFEQRIGCLPEKYTVSLKLRADAKPTFHKARTVPYALRDRVENELKALEREGAIERSENNDWGSPAVLIEKPNGQIRICSDYKISVNKQLENIDYPIPNIEETLNCLRGLNFFCTLDLYKAYLHVPVDEKSAKIQTLTTQVGSFRCKRLQFGIKSAPAEFHRVLDTILQGLNGVITYFDDIIIHAET